MGCLDVLLYKIGDFKLKKLPCYGNFSDFGEFRSKNNVFGEKYFSLVSICSIVLSFFQPNIHQTIKKQKKRGNFFDFLTNLLTTSYMF